MIQPLLTGFKVGEDLLMVADPVVLNEMVVVEAGVFDAE